MKYGIDSMMNCSEKEMALNHYMKDYIIKALNNLGYIAINCETYGIKNFGERLYNKVKIANNARVDLFFSINVSFDNNNSVTLYTKGNMAKLMAKNIIKSLNNIDFFSGNIIEDSKLYLIKNIKSEIILADIKINDINEGLLRGICKKILEVIAI